MEMALSSETLIVIQTVCLTAATEADESGKLRGRFITNCAKLIDASVAPNRPMTLCCCNGAMALSGGRERWGVSLIL